MVLDPTNSEQHGLQVKSYRRAYASRQVPYAFLPCIASTSGRIHAKFLRLIYIIAHRRTITRFQRLGIEEPGADAFTWRRGEYFYHTRAAIGLAIVEATAQRAQVADHTLRRRNPT